VRVSVRRNVERGVIMFISIECTSGYTCSQQLNTCGRTGDVVLDTSLLLLLRRVFERTLPDGLQVLICGANGGGGVTRGFILGRL
jgi:hypothetical protein